MIDELLNRNRQTIRQSLRELKRAERRTSDTVIASAIKYFDRDGDAAYVLQKMKNRYAKVITQSGPLNAENEDVYTEYADLDISTNLNAAAAIDQGFYPAITTGIGQKIGNAVGTLFNQPDQHWDFVRSGSKEKVRDDNVAELVLGIREKSRFQQTIVAGDFAASVVESCAIHVYWSGHLLQYDTVMPYNIWFVYGPSITEDGIERATNYTDIEDASAVIIQTATNKGDIDGSPDKSQYIAYIGACKPWINGRMVTYEANDCWPIPEPADGVIDYRHGGEKGEICNPLTYLKNRGNGSTDGLAKCEYPVAIFRGGQRKIGGGEVMPRSTSLFNACLELDLAWSELLKSSLDTSKLKILVKLAEGVGTNLALPTNLDMPVFKPGQDPVTLTPSTTESGAKNVEIITGLITAGFNVPGYIVLGALEGATPESGIALAIRSQPLIDFRSHRVSMNRSQVGKIFDIERGLLAEYMSDRGGKGVPIPAEIEQVWEPGTWTPPRDEETRLRAITAAEEARVIDHVAAVQRYHRLSTPEKAQNLIDTYTEREQTLKDNDSYGKEEEQQQPQGFGGLPGFR